MRQIDRYLLVRYFDGQATTDEKEAIRQWVEADESHKKKIIEERIRYDATLLIEPTHVQKRTILRFVKHWAFQTAASIVMLLGSFYAYDQYQMLQLANTFQSVYAPAGNRTKVLLPDGSIVWLNANSSLRYPMLFAKDKRVIELNGEGYFDVAKGKNPFIVKTDKYDVEVLGTVFTIEAYDVNHDFKAVLYEGSVKLYDDKQDGEDVYLQPGQTAQLEKGKLLVSPTQDPDAYRWKDGIIHIENRSFGQIMKLLEKFYDVKIVVKNEEVQTIGYQGKLRISDGVEHALRVLQKDVHFEYRRDVETNTIYINP